MTQPCHKDTALNQQCCDRKHTQWKEGEKRRGNARGSKTIQEGREQREGEDSTRTRGQHTTHHPRHSIGPQGERQGGHHTQDGEVSNTATLHSPCHPPSAMPPHHPRRPHPPPRRGGNRQRIPHHTNTTDTHSPPTHRSTWQWNNARHDSSTRQHCNGMSRARAHATALGRTAAHPTAIPHTEEDGHHPPIHSSTPTHSRSRNR